MFAAGPAAEGGAGALKSGTLFTERTLALLPLTHTAEVNDRRAGRSVRRPHPGHRRRVDRAPLTVGCEPETPDVAASFQNVWWQCRCSTRQQQHNGYERKLREILQSTAQDSRLNHTYYTIQQSSNKRPANIQLA